MDPSLVPYASDHDLWSHPSLTPSALLVDSLTVPFEFTDTYEYDLSQQVQPPLKRRRGKAFTGCLTCRERKIKCDETRPICKNCERSRLYVCRGFIDSSGAISYDNFSPQAVKTPLATNSVLLNRGGCSMPSNISRTLSKFHQVPTDQRTTTAETETARSLNGEPINPSPSQTPFASSRELEALDESCEKYEDLIAHYRDVVSYIMMPTIDSARNPWLQLYLPWALRKRPTKTQLALRYALLSVAAYHRARTSPQALSDDISKACEFEEKAASTIADLLEQCSELTETSDKCALLAAAMTMITVSLVSGDRTSCPTHIALANRVFHQTGGDVFWKSNLQSAILYQIFRCYGMLASTSQIQPEQSKSELVVEDAEDQSPQIPNTAEHGDDALIQRHYILDISFGISLQTMNLLNKIVSIAPRLLEKNNQGNWPSELFNDLKSLEESLHRIDETQSFSNSMCYPSWTLNECESYDEYSSTGLPSPISEELMINHQRAFHNAVILFFYRVVYQNTRNKKMQVLSSKYQKSGQHYVDKILESLENIDCLTRGAKVRPASTLWPCFVAGCEAIETSLRHRAFIWLSKMAKRGFGNVERAKQLVMEVWRKTDRHLDDETKIYPLGLGPVDWRLVIKESGVSILLC
ncbi:fungal-specific transcription factor domain-containing protein [Talaromyces proteolyticus]|uniref:Fungal-specific transcription factor domain-containing protein n=1 Tax=Talaromyces proteolyticus TaxID=1131652 RepID=A0AAD4KQU4_9EURO|nr:fungal-specific transcription factor domain-containing protein [Talaromyces proteolyticus]KAH8698420.1 fungal-specific transcription factor domain-containing protein [Talaromyces proteolyticus]